MPTEPVKLRWERSKIIPTVLAAYMNRAAVGWIDSSSSGVWHGRVYVEPVLLLDKADNEDAAKAAVEQAFARWLDTAGLEQREGE